LASLQNERKSTNWVSTFSDDVDGKETKGKEEGFLGNKRDDEEVFHCQETERRRVQNWGCDAV
jgi:hypothetical protein